jgi:energy-coupling factor transporter ATP-binding protein EcfA2
MQMMRDDIAKVSAGQDLEVPEKCAMCGKAFTEYDHPERIENLGWVHDFEVQYNPAHPANKEEGASTVNLFENVMKIEEGDYGTEEELAGLMQPLIDSGVAYQLQGFYGRLAEALIEKGLCSAQTESAREEQYGGEVGQIGAETQGQEMPPTQPTDQQDMTPMSQNQFVPSASIGFQQKGEDTVDCPICDQEDIPENEFDHHLSFVHGIFPKAEGPLGDPREREKDRSSEPDDKISELSPEAQKIVGVDPASQAERQADKPKLEVDVSDKTTILGKTGSGKTNLIKVLMSDILKDYQFVLLDALGNFSEYDGQSNVDYHQVSPSDTAEVDQIIYSALEKGNCMVVIDEVDRYDTKKGTMLNELVNVGRNYGVGGIFAARRTADVDKDILANSPYIFVFQHILPQDLDVLIDWFAQPEETFRDLQEYEAILFHDGDQIWQGVVPEKPTTKPTSRPPLPKKPKSKSKEPADGRPPTEGGQSAPEGKQPPPATGEGMGGEKEPETKVPEKKPPELTPADEGERMEAEKSEAMWNEVMKEEAKPSGSHETLAEYYCFHHKKDYDDHTDEEFQEDGRSSKGESWDYMRPEPIECDVCAIYEAMMARKEVGAEQRYLDHLNRVHGFDQPIPETQVDPEKVKALDRSGWADLKEDATKDEAKYAAEAPFKCEFDGQRFKYEKDWLDHLQEKHGGR